MTRHFFFFLLYALAVLFQISVLRDGGIVLSVLLALIFFRPIGHALLFAVVSGYILDIYSPFFGIHSVLAVLFTVCVYHFSITLFTNRSLSSFLFLGLIASLVYSLLFAGIGWGIALITPQDSFSPIVSLESFRQGIIALVYQSITLIILYPLFSRSVPHHFTSPR